MKRIFLCLLIAFSLTLQGFPTHPDKALPNHLYWWVDAEQKVHLMDIIYVKGAEVHADDLLGRAGLRTIPWDGGKCWFHLSNRYEDVPKRCSR